MEGGGTVQGSPHVPGGLKAPDRTADISPVMAAQLARLAGAILLAQLPFAIACNEVHTRASVALEGTWACDGVPPFHPYYPHRHELKADYWFQLGFFEAAQSEKEGPDHFGVAEALTMHSSGVSSSRS